MRQRSQLLEQRPGPTQLERVKALGEPVVDRREHIKSLLAFAALGPKPRKRSAGPQFKHLRALIGGDVDRPLEGRIGFLAGVVRRIEQQ